MHEGTCPVNATADGACVGVCDRCASHRNVNEEDASFCPRCDRPTGPESGDLDEHGIPYL